MPPSDAQWPAGTRQSVPGHLSIRVSDSPSQDCYELHIFDFVTALELSKPFIGAMQHFLGVDDDGEGLASYAALHPGTTDTFQRYRSECGSHK